MVAVLMHVFGLRLEVLIQIYFCNSWSDLSLPFLNLFLKLTYQLILHSPVLKKSKRLAFSIAKIAIKIFVLILLKPLHSMADTCLPLHTFEKLYCSSQSGWLCLVIFSLDFDTFYQSFGVHWSFFFVCKIGY